MYPDDERREDFNKLIKIKGDPNAIIVFQDEVHFLQQTSITRKWAPIGSSPKVCSPPGHKSLAFSGFLVQNTEELIVNKPNRFNSETVIESIRVLLTTSKFQKIKRCT